MVLLKDKRIIISSLILMAVIFFAIFASFVAPYNPYKTNLDTSERMQPPSFKHIFGTDELGRDVFTRVIYGSRISLSVALLAVFLMTILGVMLGALSGYFGGKIDFIIMRFVEMFMCFPTIFLILTVLAFVGPSIFNVMIIIGLTSWPGLARLVRAEFLSVKERDFVLAAKMHGFSEKRIIFKHVLPNSMAPVWVSVTLSLGSAVLTESALSFLGLGVQIPTPSWGNILGQGRFYIDYAWWLMFFPGIFILMTVLSFNFIAEALQDHFNPRTQQ